MSCAGLTCQQIGHAWRVFLAPETGLYRTCARCDAHGRVRCPASSTGDHEPTLEVMYSIGARERGFLPTILTPTAFFVNQGTQMRFVFCKHCAAIYGLPELEARAIEGL